MHKIILSVFALMIIVLATLAGCTTVIRTPPPPARVEIRPGPPYGGAVWIEGHWARRHSNWVWAPGHWKRGPGRWRH